MRNRLELEEATKDLRALVAEGAGSSHEDANEPVRALLVEKLLPAVVDESRSTRVDEARAPRAYSDD